MILPVELKLEVIEKLKTLKDINNFCSTNKSNFDFCNANKFAICTNVIKNIINQEIPIHFKDKVCTMVKEISKGDIKYFKVPSIETRQKIFDYYKEDGTQTKTFNIKPFVKNTEINKLFTYIWIKKYTDISKLLYTYDNRIILYASENTSDMIISFIINEENNINSNIYFKNLIRFIKKNIKYKYKIIDSYLLDSNDYIKIEVTIKPN